VNILAKAFFYGSGTTNPFNSKKTSSDFFFMDQEPRTLLIQKKKTLSDFQGEHKLKEEN